MLFKQALLTVLAIAIFPIFFGLLVFIALSSVPENSVYAVGLPTSYTLVNGSFSFDSPSENYYDFAAEVISLLVLRPFFDTTMVPTGLYAVQQQMDSYRRDRLRESMKHTYYNGSHLVASDYVDTLESLTIVNMADILLKNEADVLSSSSSDNVLLTVYIKLALASVAFEESGFFNSIGSIYNIAMLDLDHLMLRFNLKTWYKGTFSKITINGNKSELIQIRLNPDEIVSMFYYGNFIMIAKGKHIGQGYSHILIQHNKSFAVEIEEIKAKIVYGEFDIHDNGIDLSDLITYYYHIAEMRV